MGSFVEAYRDLLAEAEEAQWSAWLPDPGSESEEELEQLGQEVAAVLAPLGRGTIDAAVLDHAIWVHFSGRLIAEARRVVPIRVRLCELYRRLVEEGSDEDWATYARLESEGRFAAVAPLLERLSSKE